MLNEVEPPSGLQMDYTVVPEGLLDQVVGYVAVLQPEAGMSFNFTLSDDGMQVSAFQARML